MDGAESKGEGIHYLRKFAMKFAIIKIQPKDERKRVGHVNGDRERGDGVGFCPVMTLSNLCFHSF